MKLLFKQLENKILVKKEMSHKLDSILNTLNKDKYKRFILIYNKMIKITPEGEEFLNNIKKLENLIKPMKEEYDSYLNIIKNFNKEVKNEQTPF